METEEKGSQCWNFGANESLDGAGAQSIREFINILFSNASARQDRSIVPLGHGDPSAFPSFRTDTVAEDAICDAVRSAKFNCYSSTSGIPAARSAIAEYLSRDLSFQVSPDDVYLTAGAAQAIEILISVLARSGANILLPRPGFPMYEAQAAFSQLEVRHFDLLPHNGWEVDLDAVEALADTKTAAMVIINPGNPCGNVFSRQHLEKIAVTARKLGILVISDEVYAHFAYGSNPFVSMAEFSSMLPVITIGGISKRWFVPGWRLGWMVTYDPHNILKDSGLVRSLTILFNLTTDPATFIQGAIPAILEKTKEDFFKLKLEMVRECADTCYEKVKEIPCIICPCKPEGSMFTMFKLNLSLLEDIKDDLDFCIKLAREEAVVILPGRAVGLENWIRITFTAELESLREGLARLKSFAQRHAKKQ